MAEEHFEREPRWPGFVSEAVLERLGPLRNPILLGALLGLALLAATWYGWVKYGGQILDHPRYHLALEQIEVTEQPDWIRTNVRAEVVRDGSLTDLRLTDQQLLEKVAAAFTVHSWVAEVAGVRKSAARIKVDLRYRRPVAMVEVPDGLVPVDAEGVILPTEDFQPDTDGDGEIDQNEFAALQRRIQPYPRVRIPSPKSYGVEGTPWGDARVHQAALIAAECGPFWPRTGLHRITASAVDDEAAATIMYTLETRTGATVIWGSAIGGEKSGEASGQQKRQRLLRYVKQHGPLDQARPELRLDLRSDDWDVPITASRDRGFQDTK